MRRSAQHVGILIHSTRAGGLLWTENSMIPFTPSDLSDEDEDWGENPGKTENTQAHAKFYVGIVYVLFLVFTLIGFTIGFVLGRITV
jgi:hypothetical protein